MPKFGLEVAVAKMIDGIIPDDVVRQERAVKGVVAEDATVRADAIAPSLPWQRADVHIPGPAVVASSVARVAFPQGALIRHVSIFAGTAPSGIYNATAVSPTGSESISLQAGFQAGMERMKLRVPPGGWVTINVTNAGGAADVTLVLHYSSVGYSTGSTSSGGAGGGGTAVGVVSVNGKSGTVVLNADDLDDSVTTHKFVSADDLAKLQGFEPDDYVLADSIALVATSGDYGDLANRPSLFDGDYNSLSNKPVLGTAAAADTSDFATATQGGKADTSVQPSDIGAVAVSNDYDDLDNKPTIPAQFNPIAGTNLSLSGTYPNIIFNASGGGGGGGDMFASTYDPAGVADDAFDMDNMIEGTNTKVMTAAERSKLSGIAAGAEVNVQSDWNAVSGDAQILNKPLIETLSTFDQQSPSTALTSTGASSAYVNATATMLYSTTLDTILPSISSGTWDVDVVAYAVLFRSVTTGGVAVNLGDGTTRMSYALLRGFDMTGGVTVNCYGAFKGISPGSTIDMKFSGYQSAGTTSCTSYGWHITARRVS